MKKPSYLLMSAIAAFAWLLAPGAAKAADKPNLLVMGEDADEDTVPRDSRVFKRVINELQNQLNNEGYNVFDETAITLDGYVQGRVRRTDAEIIDIARSITRPPIDVATIFIIYASAEALDYTTKIHTRLEGRLLNVQTGRSMGNFEVESPSTWRAPVNCTRECILETVGGHARELAMSLGDVLVQKLTNEVTGGAATYMPPSGPAPIGGPIGGSVGGGSQNPGYVTQYVLTFENFTTREMLDWEDYLRIFSGYRNHRVSEDTGMVHSIWYESTIDDAKLHRNLQKAADKLGADVRITKDRNEYKVQKIGLRKMGGGPREDTW